MKLAGVWEKDGQSVIPVNGAKVIHHLFHLLMKYLGKDYQFHPQSEVISLSSVEIIIHSS